MKPRPRAPSAALVVSLVALFVALGGTTYAATTLPKNSVGTAQLRDGAVTKTKLSAKTVTALRGNRGPRGVPGPQGSSGSTGAPGPPGANGSAVAYAHILPDGTLDSGRSKNVSAEEYQGGGEFCLHVTVPVTNAVATVDAEFGGETGVASVILAAGDPGGDIGLLCPAGSNAMILTAGLNGMPTLLATYAIFN